MATSNNGFLHTEQQPYPSPPSLLPPWLATRSSTATNITPPSPSVTLTLSPSAAPPSQPITWSPRSLTILPSFGTENPLVCEIVECCRELEEGHRALAAHRKEAAWRLNRVELQLESEKACRRREKVEDIEAKIEALMEEQKAALDRIEAEYREQLAGLRREAEVKEQKLAEQWAAKHLRLAKFVEKMGCRSIAAEPNGR